MEVDRASPSKPIAMKSGLDLDSVGLNDKGTHKRRG